MEPNSLSEESCTNIQFREINFLWTIENFSLSDKKIGAYLQSQIFPKSGEDQNQWRLSLYPYGKREETKDYVSVYLQYIVKEKRSLTAQYGLSFKSKSGKIIRTRLLATDHFSENASYWGYRTFIKRDEVDSQLEDDVLVVDCSIKWKTDVLHTSNKRIKLDEDELKSQLINNLNDALDNGSFTDVTLLARDGKKFPANKFMLGVRSPVFMAMFQHNMRERRESTIKIKDVVGDTLKHLLHFIYTSKVDVESCDMESLLAAADKYALKDLKGVCEEELVKQIKVDNVTEFIILADRHDAKTLKKQSLKFIKAHLKDVLETDDMKDLASDQPSLFYEIMKAQSK